MPLKPLFSGLLGYSVSQSGDRLCGDLRYLPCRTPLVAWNGKDGSLFASNRFWSRLCEDAGQSLRRSFLVVCGKVTDAGTESADCAGIGNSLAGFTIPVVCDSFWQELKGHPVRLWSLYRDEHRSTHLV